MKHRYSLHQAVPQGWSTGAGTCFNIGFNNINKQHQLGQPQWQHLNYSIQCATRKTCNFDWNQNHSNCCHPRHMWRLMHCFIISVRLSGFGCRLLQWRLSCSNLMYNTPLIISGDTNIRLDHVDDASSANFTYLITMFNLTEYVEKPTHIAYFTLSSAEIAHHHPRSCWWTSGWLITTLYRGIGTWSRHHRYTKKVVRCP